ncbi:MAG TPA: M67 family metallopeptidase [Thermodesulfobacteriota bacterium]|nr:M67 family metallopeptidase [Thermodesulfobacteriota bacterium]
MEPNARIHRDWGASGYRRQNHLKMIRIPKSIYEKMVDHAKKERPLECCGILGGKKRTVEKAFELQNAEESPVLYSMAPHEQMKVFEEMEKESMEMIAIYHSHPNTVPFPSVTDVKLAFYPDVSCIIISLKEEENPVMRAFQISKKAIYLEEIEVGD